MRTLLTFVARDFALLRRDRDALLLSILLPVLVIFILSLGNSIPRAPASGFSLPPFAIRIPAFVLRSLTSDF